MRNSLIYHLSNFLILTLGYVYWFLERGQWERERERDIDVREKHQVIASCMHHLSNWLSGLTRALRPTWGQDPPPPGWAIHTQLFDLPQAVFSHAPGILQACETYSRNHSWNKHKPMESLPTSSEQRGRLGWRGLAAEQGQRPGLWLWFLTLTLGEVTVFFQD